MSFRRSSSDEPGSSRWRLKHRAELLGCGIPDSVLESDRTLTYVLLHGDDELGTGWNPSFLSREQAGQLLAFLRRELEEPTGYEIIRVLERRVQGKA